MQYKQCCSVVQYSAVQYSTVQQSTAQYSTAERNKAKQSTAQHTKDHTVYSPPRVLHRNVTSSAAPIAAERSSERQHSTQDKKRDLGSNSGMPVIQEDGLLVSVLCDVSG